MLLPLIINLHSLNCRIAAEQTFLTCAQMHKHYKRRKHFSLA